MSAGNVVAIIAAGAAIVAVAVGWIQTNSTLKQNRELADIEAVRSVLDGAVLGLLDASSQIAWIQELKETPDSLRPAWEKAELAEKRIAKELERLKVRFGLEHQIVKSFEGAVVACSEVTGATFKMLAPGKLGIDTRNEDERAAQRANLDARREEGISVIARESKRFEAERKLFLEAAHSLTGAKLRLRAP